MNMKTTFMQQLSNYLFQNGSPKLNLPLHDNGISIISVNVTPNYDNRVFSNLA